MTIGYVAYETSFSKSHMKHTKQNAQIIKNNS